MVSLKRIFLPAPIKHCGRIILGALNRWRCRLISGHISRLQNESNPHVTLIIVSGGLGDYIASMPLVKTICQSKQSSVLIYPPHMLGFPNDHAKSSNWFLATIELNYYHFIKRTRNISDNFISFCKSYYVEEVFRIGPVLLDFEEVLIEGFRLANKYTFVSKYSFWFDNVPCLGASFQTHFAKKYDVLLREIGKSSTYYRSQKALAETLGMTFADCTDDFGRLAYSSLMIPRMPYLFLQLNPADDFRSPSDAFLIKVVSLLLSRHKNWILVLVGPKEDERTGLYLDAFPNRVHSLRGETAFCDYVELIRHSVFSISADTSAAHLAAIFGIPSLVFVSAVYGNALFPYEWGKGVKRQLAIQNNVSCMNCLFRDYFERHNNQKEGCSFHNQCTKEYPFEEIKDRLIRFLEESSL